MKVDLHTHTNVSDGTLTPGELVQEAVKRKIQILSITDHDTADAYNKINPSDYPELLVIPGVEFSCEWQKTGIHVVGLNVEPGSAALDAGIATQSQAREDRAQRIAEKLGRLGLTDAYEGVKRIAGTSVIGRPHFAQLMVEQGMVNSTGQAFDKYLGKGKAGDVKQYWSSLLQVILWIRDAGGVAVLAHPDKYRLTRSKLLKLIDGFIESGGEGMEVISGTQTTKVTNKLAQICNERNLLASAGSDFHQHGQVWAELGKVAALPDTCTPVWENWN